MQKRLNRNNKSNVSWNNQFASTRVHERWARILGLKRDPLFNHRETRYKGFKTEHASKEPLKG